MKGRVCSLSLNASSLFSAIGKGSCLTMEGGKGGRELSLFCYLNFGSTPQYQPHTSHPLLQFPLPLNSGQQVVHFLVPFFAGTIQFPRLCQVTYYSFFQITSFKIVLKLHSGVTSVLWFYGFIPSFSLHFHFSVVSETEDICVQLICHV